MAKLGRRAEALKALDAALALGPNDLETRLWRAEVLHGLGKRREALAQLDEAAALNAHDKNPFFHALRGVLRAAAGDHAGLVSDHAEARRILEKRRARPLLGRERARARDLAALLARGRGLRRGSYELAIL